MNNTIELLKSHRSIRKFKDKKIDENLLNEIIRAGQAAASSSFLQGVSIIRITNQEKRKAFSELAGRYADRPGGYTRMYKLAPRKGDAAAMAMLELV